MQPDKQSTNPHDTVEWYADVPRSIRLHCFAGLALIAVSFGGFGYWAFAAPLAAAVIAQGSFVANGNNKIVQHLEGGIIEELLVTEGEKVQAGDVLVKLDQTAARANERMLNLKRLRLEAVVARLRAEALGSDTFKMPDIVADQAGDPDVRAIIESQNVNFRSKKIKLQDQLSLIGQNIRSLEFRANGYELQQESFNKQLQILNEEREAKSKLANSGLIRRPELLALDRAIADAMGEIGRLGAEVKESNTQIDRYRQEAVIAINTNKQAALDGLEAAEADLDAVREQVREAAEVLGRATIRSPVDGTVVRSYFHTAGGVIATGKPIMEILPANVPLIIEAQVLRTAIDQLKVGENATIRLSALNRRTTPVLNGKVFYVSADSIEDVAGGEQRDVYIVRVEVPASEIHRVHGFRPVPGMPAEVLITTSERTFFEYLTKPITDSMSRAFKET
ncbi:HlyD family type I secretion periplasmic adaptor subunit [Sinorhizobium numidicum]|uniref:Membrane fusion protein (MFP) family protein n=1 Tax=Sinorhizobium numidicum TaxID=680248 RepID=A0ABY8D419_9HYPH|nr:HlyD family type I secretion periplasmic adaptor subunit [Sinorhizobium numidicum]WEX77129.1 HlyD family type I secretion periplasmic adaptor subunit [Sinorhizobium numidicum]WEX83788.1 HlyD family type I secretion periplasmic adaptor subunit [Sinorhizobium numidicum]